MTNNDLITWVVYEYPKDFPEHYVARKFIGLVPTSEIIVNTELNPIRDILAQKNLVSLCRDINDNPLIVECWL